MEGSFVTNQMQDDLELSESQGGLYVHLFDGKIAKLKKKSICIKDTS